MTEVNSLSNLKLQSKAEDVFWLLIYKKNSEGSDCAFNNIKKAFSNLKEEAKLFTVNVNEVRDIHTEFNVKTVPTLLKIRKSAIKGVYKACNDVDYYTSLFLDTMYSVSGNSDVPLQKSVIVYSTPTCSWCTRIKDYLKTKNIKFRDIDVSKDQKAAQAMVKRSGQQGVPQTLIGGQLIIGFDKTKIDKLLGL